MLVYILGCNHDSMLVYSHLASFKLGSLLPFNAHTISTYESDLGLDITDVVTAVLYSVKMTMVSRKVYWIGFAVI
jgi:hypothetical protein